MPDRTMTKRDGCPDQTMFVRVLRRTAGRREREKLIDHILVCPVCRAKFDVLWGVASDPELKALVERKAHGGRPGRENRRGFLLRWISAGAALVVVLTAAAYFSGVFSSAPLYRGHNPFGLKLISPGRIVSAPPAFFEWTPATKGDSYRLILVDEDLNTVWNGEESEQWVYTDVTCRMYVPPEILKRLERGKSYVWSVQALDDNGVVFTRESRAFTIR